MKDILINTYPKYGINLTLEKLNLDESYKKEVYNMRRKLNLKRDGKYLSEDDKRYIIDNYLLVDKNILSKELGISVKSLQTIACKLGATDKFMSHNMWSEKDIQFLKENYNKISIEGLSNILNRTIIAIETKIKRLGVSTRNYWQEYEIDILKKYYPNMDKNDIHKIYLPNRTPDSINTKAIKIGLKKQQSVGWDNSTKYFSHNNDLCNSKYELLITNFLIENNINYKKEILYSKFINDSKCGKKRVDWVINDNIFVEFFGLMNVEKYRKSVKTKIDLCKNNNIELISIYPSDINNLSEIFSEYITFNVQA